MLKLVGVLVIAAFMIRAGYPIVRGRFQNIGTATRRLRKKLENDNSSTKIEIMEPHVYPLSEYMIRKMARDYGFRCKRESNRGTSYLALYRQESC